MAVARLGSFSAAAAELGYTQAAVSQQIAALENDLKTQLLNRRPVTPTEAGARLLEHAEPILLRLDAARTDVTRMTKTPAATLLIGVTPLAGATSALAPALAELRSRMPRLDITVQTATREDMAIAVARGELDLALTDGLTAPGDPLPEQAPVTATGLSRGASRGRPAPDHPLAASSRPPPARPSRRPMDRSRQRGPAASRDPPARRHRRLQARLALHRRRRHDADQPRSRRTRPNPATRDSAARQGITTVRVAAPRLCHRMELIHTALPQSSPAAALAAILSQH